MHESFTAGAAKSQRAGGIFELQAQSSPLARQKRVGKYLALILRHNPGPAGIALDAEGWTDADSVVRAVSERYGPFTRADLARLVAEDDKSRYAFSADGVRIRASQGHSVEVDLGLEPLAPPPLLYHGTKRRFLESIRVQGLIRGKRRHVHLSSDVETAAKVGDRRAGDTVILTVHAGEMSEHPFYRSANGVWLTDHVPPRFLGTLGDTARLAER